LLLTIVIQNHILLFIVIVQLV